MINLKIPASIDALLSELSQLDTLSPVLRRRLDPIFIRLLRAFDRSPPDDEALNKVARRIQECLTPAPGDALAPGDAAATPVLVRLMAEIERHRAGPSAAAPAAAPSPAPRPPPSPVASHTAPASLGRESIGREWPSRPRASPPPQPAPRPAEPRRHDSRPVPRRPPAPARTPEADPASPARTAGALLERLADLHDRRVALLHDPLAAWGALLAADAEVDRLVQSLRWMAAPGQAAALTALDGADDDGQRFAATAAMLVTGGGDAILERSIQGPLVHPHDAPAGPWLAIRSFAPADLLERALLDPHVGTHQDSGELRAILLAGLLDRGQLSAERLWALLDDPSDTVAVWAAEAMAWVGRTRTDATDMEARARTASGPRRLSAALFAATALGSAKALQSIRLRMDAGEPVTTHAIDALAIGGDAHQDDGRRLLDLSRRAPELAEQALLAAGHLGDPALLPALLAPDATIPGAAAHGREPDGGAGEDDLPDTDTADRQRRAADLRSRAARTTGGPSPGPELRPGRRFLYGAPWTLAGLMGQLTDALELLVSRRWYALEGFVRAGGRPVTVLDPRATAPRQQRATAEIQKALADEAAPPAGTWPFRGRS